MTGEDGSYDIKYNRVENMLGELTRLMDNMESSMIPQQVCLFFINSIECEFAKSKF